MRAKWRKKERADDKAAMEAVRAQIKQDREERKAKYDAEKEAENLRKKEQERKVLADKAAQAEKAVIERSQTARLQFRLPDGRHQTAQFSSSSLLSDVYDFVAKEMDTGFHCGFGLSTTFPRRNLDTQDKNKTLKQLEMAPSATVLVLPLGGVARPSQMMSLVTLLLTPLSFVWAAVTSTWGALASLLGLTPQDDNTHNQQTPNRTRGKRSDGMRQDGNVRRLPDTRDEDDENNTWNGNSTQQM